MSSTTLQQLKELGESMGLQGTALVEFIKEQQNTEREEREKLRHEKEKERVEKEKERQEKAKERQFELDREKATQITCEH